MRAATVMALLAPCLAFRRAGPLAGRRADLLRVLVTRAGATEAGAVTPVDTLRSYMEANNLDVFLVPTDDPHLSEYPPDCFARREFISGFTGSAGTAVVTREEALLWTDGRYHQQAEAQLEPSWTLMKAGLKGVPAIKDWLVEQLGKERSIRVGIDPFVHSAGFAEALSKGLAAKDHELVPLANGVNPVDAAWEASEQARPAEPVAPVRTHPKEVAGKSTAEKLAEVREAMEKKDADALVVGMLDEVAWLCNFRGSDVDFNPVALSYAVVTRDAAVLFMKGDKVPSDVRDALVENGVELRDYTEFVPFLEELSGAGKKVWIDEDRTNYAAAAAVAKENRVKGMNPVTLLKSVKNEAELAGMFASHVRDARALVRFFAWMDQTISEEGKTVTEVEVDDMLTGKFRQELEGFIEPSFPTIAGAGPNGAIIHYRASGEDCGVVGPGTVLLLDSGGQYHDGTTDCTRTMVFGKDAERLVPLEVRETFTRVLQGNIRLDRCCFPEGTPGCVLDVLAREELWRAGQDYAHGTGHGVGAALNVHEGPQSISPRFNNKQALLPGMILSNEPGFYEPSKFGIRIENLLVVEQADGLESAATGKKFLRFKKLTQVPICKALIVKELLRQDEIDWLDQYHASILAQLAPALHGSERAWLEAACAPL